MSQDVIDQMVIYNRLLEIKVDINNDPIPNPSYISSKIKECHRHIEEIEAYSIRVTRATSILQQSLNNARAEYQTKFDNLLVHDESIRTMQGNIKDREAKANQLLKAELEKVKECENTLSVYDNLSTAINLKMKNLNRLNNDIRTMVRMMESQIKLSGLPKTDPVISRLAEEMSKSHLGEDSFKGAEATVVKETTVDPTAPLDPLAILKGMIEDGFVDPLPGTIDPDNDKVSEDKPETELEDEIDKLKDDDPFWTPEESGEEEEKDTITIDLDQMAITPVTETSEQGGAPVEAEPNVQEQPSTQTFKEEKHADDSTKGINGSHVSPNVIASPNKGVDLDDLLDKIIASTQKE